MVQEHKGLSLTFLKAKQYGVAVKGGIEYAFHSTRIFLDAKYDEHDVLWNENDREPSEDAKKSMEEAIPTTLQMDLSKAYQGFRRDAAFHRIKNEHPTMLRFFVFAYGKPSKLWVMHLGKVVKCIDSVHGSQQGDVMGGVYFGFGILEFAEGLSEEVPDAHMVWIIDDLTVTGGIKEAAKAAAYIKEEGPKWGLFLSKKEGGRTAFAPEGTTGQHMDKLVEELGFQHRPGGLQRLLGAPLTRNHEKDFDWAVQLVKKKLDPIKELARIGDTQVEFLLLRGGYAARTPYMMRLLPPAAMEGAIMHHDYFIRREIGRLCLGEAASGPKGTYPGFTDLNWEVAKQPVREIGLGLGDLAIIAPAAYVAALGGVARLNQKVDDLTKATSAKTIATQLTKDTTLKEVVQGLNDSQPAASTKPIVPPVSEIKTFPEQKTMARKLLKDNADKILESIDAPTAAVANKRHDRSPEEGQKLRENRMKKSWLTSQRQFGAGAQFNAIPRFDFFQKSSPIYRTMLCMAVCVDIPALKNLRCPCGKDHDWKGNHTQACHHHSDYSMRHDKLLMDIVALHKQLRMKTTLEPIGLIPGTNIYRPADLLPVPYLNDVKALGLDICVTTAVSEQAASGKVDVRKPLWAAETKEKDKKKDDAKKLQSLRLTERDVDYIKTPLVYETTGGFGKEARKWFKKVQLEFRKNNGDSLGTLGGLGYDHTWSANSFTQWWTQRFAMTITSHVAACAWQAGFTPGTGGAARLGAQQEG